jgi:hypothetical protein
MDIKEARANAKAVLVYWFRPEDSDDVLRRPTTPPTRSDYIDCKRKFDKAGAAYKQALVDFARTQATTVDERIVDAARQGDRDAHVYLWWVAVWLTAHTVPLPPLLQEYIVVDAPVFKRCRGRRPGGDIVARGGIALAVAVLTRYGIPLTRNRHTRTPGPTACAIVVEILKEIGITKTEAAVEKIFYEHRQHSERVAAEAVQVSENKLGDLN